MDAPARTEYQEVTKHFGPSRGGRTGSLTAVRDVSLSVAEGEVVSLIGPSGCGKSTLLNMGSGLYPPSSGRVYLNGELVDGPNRHVAFMLTVIGILAYGLVILAERRVLHFMPRSSETGG